MTFWTGWSAPDHRWTKSILASAPSDARGSRAGAARAAAVARVKRRRLTARDIATSKKRMGRVLSPALMSVRSEARARETALPDGTYDVIVIDPPWPVEKIERDVRPNQSARLDYPTMTEAELEALAIPTAADSHVWLWTTQRFVPMAFRLLERWGFRYVCTFVWRKPGGFQPIGLPQFNCEFALYARKGTPLFANTKAFPTCFEAPRGQHGEKPDKFYDLLRRVTAGRRLDMFNRRPIEGFTGWGNQAS